MVSKNREFYADFKNANLHLYLSDKMTPEKIKFKNNKNRA
jgi:hypothetical protein